MPATVASAPYPGQLWEWRRGARSCRSQGNPASCCGSGLLWERIVSATAELRSERSQWQACSAAVADTIHSHIKPSFVVEAPQAHRLCGQDGRSTPPPRIKSGAGSVCRRAGGETRPAGASTRMCSCSPSAGCAVGEPSEPERAPAGRGGCVRARSNWRAAPCRSSMSIHCAGLLWERIVSATAELRSDRSQWQACSAAVADTIRSHNSSPT